MINVTKLDGSIIMGYIHQFRIDIFYWVHSTKVFLSLVAFAVISFYVSTVGFWIVWSAFLFFTGFPALLYTLHAPRIRISVGSWNYIKDFIVEGLANTPAKLARMLSLNLSIILLATVGISTSEVGTFYIAITISITVSSLITSMGFMIIPTSAESKRNLSFISLKFGVSLTTPLIAGLVAAPQFILSLIGPQYIAETTSLVVLSIAILPYSILTTSISSFNLTGNFRKIILVGCVQVVTFLLTFFILAPSFVTVGSSIAILMAFISSSSICLVWMALREGIWNSLR
jgi:O-antigen/teichoic acid export membrane protein